MPPRALDEDESGLMLCDVVDAGYHPRSVHKSVLQSRMAAPCAFNSVTSLCIHGGLNFQAVGPIVLCLTVSRSGSCATRTLSAEAWRTATSNAYPVRSPISRSTALLQGIRALGRLGV